MSKAGTNFALYSSLSGLTFFFCLSFYLVSSHFNDQVCLPWLLRHLLAECPHLLRMHQENVNFTTGFSFTIVNMQILCKRLSEIYICNYLSSFLLSTLITPNCLHAKYPKLHLIRNRKVPHMNQLK